MDLRRFCETSPQNSHFPTGVVYIDGVGDFSQASIPLNVNLESDFPPFDVISGYLVVLVPFSRCKSAYDLECKVGRFCGSQSSSKSERPSKRQRQSHFRETAIDTKRPAVCSLLQIRWLRLIVDEGHELGGSNAPLELTTFIHEIAAERRWVLSGTPTTGDRDSPSYTTNALEQLQRLLCFLRHPIYGTIPKSQLASSEASGDDLALARWGTEIQQPFASNRDISARNKLLRLLKEIMVMHRKEDIDLPLPIFTSGEVEVGVPEAVEQQILQYRDNPMAAKSSLESYLSSDTYQSLVDEAQGKHLLA